MRVTIEKGFLGVASSTGGVIISNLPAVEQWLRITSLVVGISIGILSGVSILCNLRKKK